MRLGSAGSDELVANQQRKRQVDEAVAVNVAKLAPSKREFGAAEPVPSSGDSRPRCNFADDGGVDGLSHMHPY